MRSGVQIKRLNISLSVKKLENAQISEIRSDQKMLTQKEKLKQQLEDLNTSSPVQTESPLLRLIPFTTKQVVQKKSSKNQLISPPGFGKSALQTQKKKFCFPSEKNESLSLTQDSPQFIRIKLNQNKSEQARKTQSTLKVQKTIQQKQPQNSILFKQASKQTSDIQKTFTAYKPVLSIKTKTLKRLIQSEQGIQQDFSSWINLIQSSRNNGLSPICSSQCPSQNSPIIIKKHESDSPKTELVVNQKNRKKYLQLDKSINSKPSIKDSKEESFLLQGRKQQSQDQKLEKQNVRDEKIFVSSNESSKLKKLKSLKRTISKKELKRQTQLPFKEQSLNASVNEDYFHTPQKKSFNQHNFSKEKFKESINLSYCQYDTASRKWFQNQNPRLIRDNALLQQKARKRTVKKRKTVKIDEEEVLLSQLQDSSEDEADQQPLYKQNSLSIETLFMYKNLNLNFTYLKRLNQLVALRWLKQTSAASIQEIISEQNLNFQSTATSYIIGSITKPTLDQVLNDKSQTLKYLTNKLYRSLYENRHNLPDNLAFFIVYYLNNSKTHFPEDFLTPYERNRIQNKYVVNLKEVSSLLICFFLLTKILIEKLILKPNKYKVDNQKLNKQQKQNLKLVGSVFQAIIVRSFQWIGRSEYEKVMIEKDIGSGNYINSCSKNQDEISDKLYDCKDLKQFITSNQQWMEEMQSRVMKYGMQLKKVAKRKVFSYSSILE